MLESPLLTSYLRAWAMISEGFSEQVITPGKTTTDVNISDRNQKDDSDHIEY